MLVEWQYWLSSLRPDQLWSVLGFALFVDGPRYAFCTFLMSIVDAFYVVWDWLLGRREPTEYEYCPTIALLLVGHNEGDSIEAGLLSVWGRYPRMEIIVVDDGSSDDMAANARRFAHDHQGVLVLSRDERGGKSSALNWALAYTRAEIVLCVDTDSHLSDTSLWEIVQPFTDPTVGAVSACVEARNSLDNLCTWMQAYEYRQTIYLGRLLQERLGMLAIVSGAFGAFRRSLLEQVGAWDVGPGEDGDVTLRIRKAGYCVAVAPRATCLTDVPTEWFRLFKQRCRWDRTVVTFECRKHLDLSFFWYANFRWSNLGMMLERWFFNVVCVYTFWGYAYWLTFVFSGDLLNLLILLYLMQIGLETVQFLLLLCYSYSPGRDLCTAAVLPFYPLYQVFLKAADLVAVTEELFFRKSRDDNFVPLRVREATWHW